MNNENSHIRLAKNTVALYIRSLLSVIIGLYTSKIVINTLGVDDYGVYGVVGGFVGMLGFINAAMSGATSRFITYEMGLGLHERTKSTFANALMVHMWIALLIIVICETLGVWFINNKLNIPAESMTAANWVFQLSVLTAAITITQVPYTALIISHEKMGVYAYMEIINVSLKLAIVYFLLVIPGDKLIIYALLTAIVSLGVALAYRIYCVHNFSESKTGPRFNKSIFKPLLSFSSWDLYGNMCATARIQGTTFILNIFFGVVVNGAASIANVINSTVSGFSNNIITAIRPQIIKNYAQNAFGHFQSLIELGSQMSFFLLSVMAIPLFLDMHYVYEIWLDQVPEHVVVFSRIILITMFIIQFNNVIGIGIHATGKIKLISFVSGSLCILILPVIYVAFRLGWEPATAFYANLLVFGLIYLSNIIILKHNVKEFSCQHYMKKMLMLIIQSIPACAVCYMIHRFMPLSFWRLILECVSSVIIIGLTVYFFILPEDKRSLICNKIKRILCKSKLS